MITGVLVLVTGLLALRGRGRWRLAGAVLIALLITEFSVGVAAILTDLPVWLAVGHNWLAALLLIALLWLLALTFIPAQSADA